MVNRRENVTMACYYGMIQHGASITSYCIYAHNPYSITQVLKQTQLHVFETEAIRIIVTIHYSTALKDVRFKQYFHPKV